MATVLPFWFFEIVLVFVLIWYLPFLAFAVVFGSCLQRCVEETMPAGTVRSSDFRTFVSAGCPCEDLPLPGPTLHQQILAATVLGCLLSKTRPSNQKHVFYAGNRQKSDWTRWALIGLCPCRALHPWHRFVWFWHCLRTRTLWVGTSSLHSWFLESTTVDRLDLWPFAPKHRVSMLSLCLWHCQFGAWPRTFQSILTYSILSLQTWHLKPLCRGTRLNISLSLAAGVSWVDV